MIDAYPGSRSNQIGDWIEVAALSQGTALGNKALIDFGAAAGLREADIGLGLLTVKRRAALLGNDYPFRVGVGIAALPDAINKPWTSLLLMTTVTRETSLSTLSLHLEQLTAAALARFYGDQTQVLRFGWPSDEGRPQEFPDAIRWLASRMGAPIGAAYRPPFRKDGGVDIVAWRPFPDGRSGFPVLLTQCTLEQAYAHKASDIDLRIWSGWLSLDIDPTTALSVPSVVPAGEDWNALAARTVILDRIRLAGLLTGSPTNPRLAAVQAWTSESVQRLREQGCP
jgi:hypothetical protein